MDSPENTRISTAVVLNDYCHVQGGASRVAVDEAVALAARGLRVIFLGASGPVCDQLKNAPVEVVCLEQPELLEVGKNPGVIVQGLYNRQAKRRMEEILRGCDPARTVVHLHGYTKALTTSPVRAAADMGFAVVCTLHDFYTACPNGAFFDFQKRAVCPKRGLSADCIATHCDKRRYAHKLFRVARGAAQRALGHLPQAVKHYITLSDNSVRILRPYLPPEAQFYPLENISEVEKAPPVDVAGKKAIVAVGRLDIEKGVEDLLAAARQTGVPLVFVGDGPLRPLADAAPDCRVTGWVTPRQVMAELEEARCLVFSSLWYETYGLVVAEAAARGIPAIVSTVSAASERVRDGVEGWHVRAGDAGDLARCLMLTRDDAAVRAAGLAAYARFWANPPTRERHVDGLLAVYERILARGALPVQGAAHGG